MLNGQSGNAVSSDAKTASSQNGEVKAPVPEIKSVNVPKVGSFSALIIVATILTIVGTAALYVMELAKKSDLEKKQAEFQALNKQLTVGSLAQLDKDIQEIQAGRDRLKEALSDKIYWSKFWQQLNSVTPKNVTYNSMSVDKTGTVSVSGLAENFSSVAKLMVSLQQSSVFSNIALGSTSLKTEGGKTQTAFSITFNVNKSELNK